MDITIKGMIPPPDLKNKATQPFRIGDVKNKNIEFKEKLVSLFSDVPSGSSPASNLDATDLRLPTEQELLIQIRPNISNTSNETDIAAQSKLLFSNPFGDQLNGIHRITIPTPGNATENEDQQQHAETAQLPPLSQDEKNKILFNTYESHVAYMRQQRHMQQEIASLFLHSLPRQYQSAIAPTPPPGHALSPESNSAMKTPATNAPRKGRRQRKKRDMSLQIPTVPLSTVRTQHRDDINTPITTTTTTTTTSAAVLQDDEVCDDEIIVKIAVYLPHAPSKISEEWLVLGSQSLTDLKDAIYCLHEVNIKNTEKVENEKRRKLNQEPCQLASTSGYFYIEGTFFIDTRDENAVDYSEHIRKYNREHSIKAPPHPPPSPLSQPVSATIQEFSVDTMQSRKFEDLWIRLGQTSPSLYCHLGGCEHLMLFVDVRMFDKLSDPRLKSHYPFRMSNPGEILVHRKKCEACGMKTAKKLTWDDKNTPHNPFFWCDECYTLMHYGADSRALYTDFKVFPYSHDYLMSVMHTA